MRGMSVPVWWVIGYLLVGLAVSWVAWRWLSHRDGTDSTELYYYLVPLFMWPVCLVAALLWKGTVVTVPSYPVWREERCRRAARKEQAREVMPADWEEG